MLPGRSITRWFRFSDYKVWQKMAFIGIPFLLPIGVLTYLLLTNITTSIRTTEQEKSGLEYMKALRGVRQQLQTHRSLSAVVLAGDNSFEAQRKAKQDEVDRAMAEVDPVEARSGKTFNVSESWGAIRADWEALKAGLEKLPPQKCMELHTALIGKVITAGKDVGQYSTLDLDPSSDAYYIAISLSNLLPEYSEYLALARARSMLIAHRKKITPTEKTDLSTLVAQAETEREHFRRNMNNVKLVNAAAFEKIEPALQALVTGTQSYIDFLQDTLINQTDDVTVTPKEAFEAAARALDANYGTIDTSTPVLLGMLDQRVAGDRATLYYAAAGIVVGLGLLTLVTYMTVRSITRQVDAIQSMFSSIGMGDFSARARITNGDELGEMAISLNAMLDNTLNLIQSREERDQIQNSIQKLLEEVAGVADGDLSKEAEVTADVTGAIADSFNHMIDQLRKIIGNVQEATIQVSTSATQIQSTAESLAQGSDNQAEQIVSTSAAIDEMAVSIQQVSENAQVASGVAKESLEIAGKGNDAVANTIDGMSRIRDQVQETAKRIKRLGESSQEIGQIIQLIDDIADRTSILALNASIQAAAAGEAGRGFAVVATEVERLAERSTDATKKIATLVKTIQGETNEAVGAMEKSILEVVEGSKRANQAGKSLDEIKGVSNRLADLIQSISMAANQQARGSEALAQSMSDISGITQQTASGTKQAADAVSELAMLADSLRDSVSMFRLPESQPRSRGRGAGNGKANGHGPVSPSSRLAALVGK